MKPLLGLVVGLLAGSVAGAQPVAQSDAAKGAIVARGPTGTFEPLPEKPTLEAEQLVLLQPDVAVTSLDGRVRLTSRADYLGLSPLPILETAVVLHKPGTASIDVTLDRGRIEVQNAGKTPVVVQLSFARQKWAITLATTDAKVAVEVVGRWPAGTDFRLKPVAGYEPTLSAVLLQLAGTSTVSTGSTTLSLGAPPGPALITWTSADGRDPEPARLDKLPDWADPAHRYPEPMAAKIRSMSAAVSKYRTLRNEHPAKATDAFLNSANSDERRIGLVVAGAEDDLERLANGITEAKDLEVWDFGITVLRHWLGRGPGQEQKFHRFLTDARQYSSGDAAKLIRLLHGFTPRERARPELYEVLIEYLRHDRAAFRNLAAWHLVRLAPDAPTVPFKTNGSKADFEPVYTMWRTLIPSGTVPREPTKTP